MKSIRLGILMMILALASVGCRGSESLATPSNLQEEAEQTTPAANQQMIDGKYTLGTLIEADTTVTGWQQELADRIQPLQIIYSYQLGEQESTVQAVYGYQSFPSIEFTSDAQNTEYGGYCLFVDAKYSEDITPRYVNVDDASVFSAFWELIMSPEYAGQEIPDETSETYCDFYITCKDGANESFRIFHNGVIVRNGKAVCLEKLTEEQAAYFFAVFAAYRTAATDRILYCQFRIKDNGFVILLDDNHGSKILKGDAAEAFLNALSDIPYDEAVGYGYKCHAIVNRELSDRGGVLFTFTIGTEDEVRALEGKQHNGGSLHNTFTVFSDGTVAKQRDASVLNNIYAVKRTIDVLFVNGWYVSETKFDIASLEKLIGT